MHTTVEQENVALVRRGFEAFNTGDGATLNAMFRPDARWVGPRTGVLSGTYRDRSEIFAMFQQLAEETHGTFRVLPDAFAASGDLVFVHTTATGERKGRKLSSDEVLVFSIAAGLVAKINLYLNDFAANDAFWS